MELLESGQTELKKENKIVIVQIVMNFLLNSNSISSL